MIFIRLTTTEEQEIAVQTEQILQVSAIEEGTKVYLQNLPDVVVIDEFTDIISELETPSAPIKGYQKDDS